MKLISLWLFSAVACFATTTFSVTDSRFSVSPYNWAPITVGGSTAAIRSINQGAFVDLSFTGTSAVLTVDASTLITNVSGISIYRIIDHGPLVQIFPNVNFGDTSSTLATGLSDTTHTMLLFFSIIDLATNDLWPGDASLTITGITVDTGKTIIASESATKYPNIILFGDSTMMGYPNLPAYSFGNFLAQSLPARWGNCAFSGQGWTTGVQGTSPGLVAGWQSIYNGQSRTFSPTPQVLINNMGENGSVSAATVTTWIGSVRAVLPNAYINQVMPFNQTGSFNANVPQNILNIKQGFADYQSAHPSDARLNVVDLGSAGQAIIDNPLYSPDGVHPNPLGAAKLCALASPLILWPERYAPPGNPTTSAVGAGF